MKTAVTAFARLVTHLALAGLLIWSAFSPGEAAAQTSPSGAYRRAVLVSWDGVRRDVVHELLEMNDPSQPCWDGGEVFPVATGRVNSQGESVYTCLPALGGAVPFDAPAGSPAYAPFQILASHTTNDGTTMTKPQHASMLTGLNAETHGLVGNDTSGPMVPGITIYEMLMDAFDPLSDEGERDGFIFRTHQSSDKKYVGRAIDNWARRSDALQVATGHGNGEGTNPGPLRHAERSFERWKLDEQELGLGETYLFMFLHFKTPDWSGHRSGADSRAYRRTITETDRKLYLLMEMLRHYGWGDAAILVTTDHGFHRVHHTRDAGRGVFNTWLAAYNVTLSVDHIPMRTTEDYCASYNTPELCLTEPMPPEDVVPNVFVTAITPTLLDMFGVEWRTTTQIEGISLYR